MYVCLCNRYRDSDIRALAEQGVRCARQAYRQLGNGPECGQCVEFAQELIDTIHTAPPVTTAPAHPALRRERAQS